MALQVSRAVLALAIVATAIIAWAIAQGIGEALGGGLVERLVP